MSKGTLTEVGPEQLIGVYWLHGYRKTPKYVFKNNMSLMNSKNLTNVDT
jgi:hypothetical protein